MMAWGVGQTDSMGTDGREASFLAHSVGVAI